MCVIAVKDKDSYITDEIIQNCGESNRDGCGYMYPDPNTGKLVIRKFLNYDQLIQSYQTVIRENLGEDKTPVILHFRVATHGSVSLANCHPFYIREGILGMAHNGVFRDIEITGDMTDSETWARNYLGWMETKHLDDRASFNLITKASGHNKLAFMDNTGRMMVINYGDGIYDKTSGCWFSNRSFQPSTPVIYQWKARYRHLEDETETGTEVRVLKADRLLKEGKLPCPACHAELPPQSEWPKAELVVCTKCGEVVACPYCDVPLGEVDYQYDYCFQCDHNLTHVFNKEI